MNEREAVLVADIALARPPRSDQHLRRARRRGLGPKPADVLMSGRGIDPFEQVVGN